MDLFARRAEEEEEEEDVTVNDSPNRAINTGRNIIVRLLSTALGYV